MLLIQVKRSPGLRSPVEVDASLELPGLSVMELVGVVYHAGSSFKTGHYVCAVRDSLGEFWLYDDDWDPVRLGGDIAHVRQREVYLVVYCRRAGVARWAVPEVGSIVRDGIGCDLSTGDPANAGVQGTKGKGCPVEGRVGSAAGVGSVGSGVVPPRRRLLRKVSSAAVSTGLPATPRRRLGRVLTMDSVASSPLIRLSTEAERLEAARLQAVGDPVAEEWDMEAGSAVAGVGAACSGVAVASPVLRRVRSKSRPRSPSASPPVSPARASLRRQAEEVRRAWDPAVPDITRCLARVHVKHECFRQCTRTANAGRYCAGHKNHMPFGVVGQCVPDNVSAQVVSWRHCFEVVR